jgi:hypothetical protein
MIRHPFTNSDDPLVECPVCMGVKKDCPRCGGSGEILYSELEPEEISAWGIFNEDWMAPALGVDERKDEEGPTDKDDS